MCCSSAHTDIHLHKIETYVHVWCRHSNSAFVSQGTLEEQYGNTTIPAAELDLEKEGRCSDVKTQQPQQTKTPLCFPAKVLWWQEGCLNFRKRVTHSQAQLKRQTLVPEMPVQLSAAANLPFPLWEGRAQARSWQVGQGKKQNTRPRTAP